MKFSQWFHNALGIEYRWNRTHGKVKVDRSKLWRALKLGAAGFVFVMAGLFAWYSKDLPTPGKIRERQAAESTKLYDRNGQLLYELHGDEKRTILKSENIPQTIRQATITAEDRNFYHNIGIDLRGLARAALLDIFTGQRVGGSTITQQYVKNALLTNAKSFDRKIKELILSLEVEAMFTKDEILTAYLNEIPYGNNNYGIEAASQAYFGKDAKDLKLAESAMLAAIPQAPTYYSPYGTHTKELKARRDWVLSSMAQLGYANQSDVDAAFKTEIAVLPRHDSIEAPHFVFYVREQLVQMFDEQAVEEGGLRVTTSLDLNFQRRADDAITANMDNLRRRGGSNAALVSIKPETGEVLAMVGSADYFDTAHDGNVNVTLSDRQPGSSFKPIVYATAFKGKYNPASILWDVPTDFGNYKPTNYTGQNYGPVTVRTALSNSLNVPAVKMLGLVGIKDALATAHDMGITTLNEPDRYGLSLVLGGGEVKPIDMADAFAVFANGGTYRPPVSILKVEGSHGNVLYQWQPGKGEKEVLDPNISYEISSILSDNAARSMIFGAYSALYFPDRPVAVKTGTTSAFHDAWTVGYTPGLSTAVWTGNNDNTAMHEGADGSVVAAPIFHQYLEAALDPTDARTFERPSSIKAVTVDKLSTKLPTDQSPEMMTDIFAPWQVPTDRDNIHQVIKVNKVNGKLATDLTPASLTEDRVYTIVHSEKPSSPNWENPVLDWASSHGLITGSPPTQKDDEYTTATVPTINLTTPKDGATVSGTFTIEATANAAFGVRSVDLAIDGVGQGFDPTPPYRFSVQASQLSVGNHKITMTVYDKNGASTGQTITVTVLGDTTPPGQVTNVTAQGLNQGARLTWHAPSDPDVERVRIYISTNPGQIGTLYPTEVLTNPGASGSFDIANLQNGTLYFFTIRAVDSSGNESPTPKYQVSATPNP